MRPGSAATLLQEDAIRVKRIDSLVKGFLDICCWKFAPCRITYANIFRNPTRACPFVAGGQITMNFSGVLALLCLSVGVSLLAAAQDLPYQVRPTS